MSKANGFIKFDRDLWRSPEVLALSTPAKVVLVELHYRYTPWNNGSIRLSWVEAQEILKCKRRAVAKYFAELHKAGLIETTVKGSFDHKDGARKGCCNQYRLVHPPRNTK